MNYKEKSIEAIEGFIFRYENEINIVGAFSATDCPLCRMYCNRDDENCNGCFMAFDIRGEVGCKTTTGMHSYYVSSKTKQKAVKIRAKWHRRNLPYLKKIPAKYFTPEGWENFDTIKDSNGVNIMPKGWRTWKPESEE